MSKTNNKWFIVGLVAILALPSMTVTEMIITRNYREADRKPEDIERIVWHWTANEHETADADNNARYFGKKNKYKASAHYIVDDHQCVQCVKDEDIAFHTGSKRKWGNKASIGIEICANFTTSEDSIKTFQEAIKLGKELYRKYPLAKHVRHYDYTGKKCPKWFVENEYQTKEEAELKFIGFLAQIDPAVAKMTAEMWGMPYFENSLFTNITSN